MTNMVYRVFEEFEKRGFNMEDVRGWVQESDRDELPLEYVSLELTEELEKICEENGWDYIEVSTSDWR